MGNQRSSTGLCSEQHAYDARRRSQDMPTSNLPAFRYVWSLFLCLFPECQTGARRYIFVWQQTQQQQAIHLAVTKRYSRHNSRYQCIKSPAQGAQFLAESQPSRTSRLAPEIVWMIQIQARQGSRAMHFHVGFRDERDVE